MYVYQFLNSNSNFKTVSFKSSKFTICHINPYPEQDHLRNSNFATLFQTYYWKWLNTVEPLFCSTYRGFIRSYDPGSSTCDLRRAEYIMNLYGTHNIKKINKRLHWLFHSHQPQRLWKHLHLLKTHNMASLIASVSAMDPTNEVHSMNLAKILQKVQHPESWAHWLPEGRLKLQ